MNSNDWKLVSLEDVVDILGDGLHGTPKYNDEGDYYFINGNNLEGYILINEKTKKVDYEEYLKYKKDLNDRTILVSINGTLGKVAVYNGEKVVLGKSACYFNVKKNYNKDFVKYVMYSKGFKDYLNTHSTGTTIKNMGLKQMRAFKFNIPHLNEQKAIANILLSLDNKIEVNNAINKKLEEIAQAIFKQWFVDFEFPNEEGKPYKSSGGAMVESELGMIPEGWEVKKINDVVSVLSKGTTPTKRDIETASDESIVKFLKVKDINDNGNIIMDNIETIPRSVHLGKLKRSILKEWDILFSIAGTIGRVSFIDKRLEDSNSNQAISFIRLKEPKEMFNFMHSLLKSNKVQNEIKSKIVQAVQANVSLGVIKDISFVLPDKNILNQYNKIVVSLYNRILSIQNETGHLRMIRDTLLPKLMSCEIRVPLDKE